MNTLSDTMVKLAELSTGDLFYDALLVALLLAGLGWLIIR